MVKKVNIEIYITLMMLEPYAMKVARTVLRRGKLVKAYLFQLDTPVFFAVNDANQLLVIYC